MLIGDEWWRLLPNGVTPDAARILWIRGLRAFADGFVALLLPVYLIELGFSAFAVGAIITATLIGSACLTLGVGVFANRYPRRRLLRAAGLLMAATGLGFTLSTDLWPILIIAFVGTMNPSSGDVSVFLPLEHTVLSQSIEPKRRTALFARYSLAGSLLGAVGALAAAIPDLTAGWTGLSLPDAMRIMFVLYGAVGLTSFIVYRRLSPAIERTSNAPPAPLKESRSTVYRLAALFCIDSFGGGFLVQSILALWLYQHFGVSVSTMAAILFWSSICTAVSQLVAVPVAERFGLINTMVFTHLPANVCIMLVPFAPNLEVAIALLLVRGALSQMDVPTRSSYVMAVVTPEERPAAASLTAVPRSFASAVGPLAAGYLLTVSTFGWPLVVGGALKVVYDLLLLINFRRIRPPEEVDRSG
ncbi:major facilitator superfamily MFS_1 [alpha proteobacterium BAL199]|jgi:MFS family permease|nr:major facilitator superfamily MFS_1 [alpha proteobacterium BAL199]